MMLLRLPATQLLSSTIPAVLSPIHSLLLRDRWIRAVLRLWLRLWLSLRRVVVLFALIYILSARLVRSPKDIVKLDADENPYGPPPEVMEALGKMEFPNIYPDPESRRLRAALTEESGLGAEHILVGSAHLISSTRYVISEAWVPVWRTCLESGRSSLDSGRSVREHEYRCCTATVRSGDKVVLQFGWLAGRTDGQGDERGSVVEGVEARRDGGPYGTTWGTARLRAVRVCVKVTHKSTLDLGITEFLWRAKQPYNVSVAAEVAACAALKNPDYLEEVKVALVNEREKLFKQLQDVPFLTPQPSNSNFILCSVTDSSYMELKNYIRISVGRPEHTDAFFAALAEVS
ncbi:unnamed protein product [Calypogeia fissa]